MNKLINFISKNHGVVLIIFVILAFLLPELFLWVNEPFLGINLINLFLGIIMFGMGVTLTLEDFKEIARTPMDTVKAAIFQFTIMPLIAYLLSMIFSLEQALMLGVVLVGSTPGGTASNVITYLAGGDVALSVAMTTASTLLAPLLTPIIVYILVGESITFSVLGMFLSIVQIVIIPIALGLGVKYLLREKSEVLEDYMPVVSSIVISLVVAGIISANVDAIVEYFGVIALVVVLHNILGMLIGYYAGKLTNMNDKKSTTLSIEVGLQNSGLASSLAVTHFPALPLAAVPGALFGAWQNIAGSIFAWYRQRKLEKGNTEEKTEKGKTEKEEVENTQNTIKEKN